MKRIFVTFMLNASIALLGMSNLVTAQAADTSGLGIRTANLVRTAAATETGTEKDILLFNIGSFIRAMNKEQWEIFLEEIPVPPKDEAVSETVLVNVVKQEHANAYYRAIDWAERTDVLSKWTKDNRKKLLKFAVLETLPQAFAKMLEKDESIDFTSRPKNGLSLFEELVINDVHGTKLIQLRDYSFFGPDSADNPNDHSALSLALANTNFAAVALLTNGKQKGYCFQDNPNGKKVSDKQTKWFFTREYGEDPDEWSNESLTIKKRAPQFYNNSWLSNNLYYIGGKCLDDLVDLISPWHNSLEYYNGQFFDHSK